MTSMVVQGQETPRIILILKPLLQKGCRGFLKSFSKKSAFKKSDPLTVLVSKADKQTFNQLKRIVMKSLKSKIIATGALAVVVALIAADHIDAPAVQGGSSDITDYYAFQGENTDNLVFVANVQGLLSPAATGAASFDENVLIEFNIDNDGDNIEDLVIQAIPRDGKMHFFGPVAPGNAGLASTIKTDATVGKVDVTSYGGSAIISNENGMKYFAGPRDDPFFFDFGQYTEIIAGNATSFNDPGTDTFAGTNVLSVVVEVPKSMLGGSGSLNTWVESKTK